MKKFFMLAAVAAISLPAHAFAAHHMHHHSAAWKSAHPCKHHARHCMTRQAGSASTDDLNARSLQQARGMVPAGSTAPDAPSATATVPTMPQASVTQPTVNGGTVTAPGVKVTR